MMLPPGTKVHVVERRLFDNDIRRHFLGEIVEETPSAALVRGWVFVYDGSSAAFQRQPELRTRVVTLVDARIIINVLPEEADLASTVYEVGDGGSLTVTDGANFRLAMSEFGFRR